MQEKIWNKALNLNFIHNDTDLPFDENSFDAIILFGILSAIVDDDFQKSLISEIQRVLKPNGIIYVNDFLINSNMLYIKSG